MIDRWLEIHRHLLAGDYDDWWPGHADIRTGDPAYKDRFEPTPTFGRPVWDGSSFDGTLLVNANFGMGDTIQFYRFMPLVRARVGRVILRCDEDFRSLFRDTEVAPSRDPLPEFDQIIHMMALPKVLGVKKADIAGKPYLSPQPCYPPGYVADMASTIKAMRSSKIGLCWRGNPFNPRDRIRSMPESARDRFTGHRFGDQVLQFEQDRSSSADVLEHEAVHERLGRDRSAAGADGSGRFGGHRRRTPRRRDGRADVGHCADRRSGLAVGCGRRPDALV